MINITEFVKSVKSKKIKLVPFIKDVLQKCNELNKDYNCFITICEKQAIAQAKQIAKNPKGRLAGVPVTVKDSICVKNVQCTAGSKILQGYEPPFDATVIQRLKAEGAIIIGKTSMDEFGFGSYSTNCAYEIPKNPFDTNRATGGSSGGSACITQLADFPHISIGESTGGSISCPSFFCGVYGLTPTYGLVSRYGLIDYANSLDKIGPIGKSTLDVAKTLSIIAGKDDYDQTTLNTKKTDYTKFKSIKGYKIGLPKQYFENISEDVKKSVDKAIDVLKSLGAKFVPIDLKMTKYVVPAYYLAAVSEASTNLARLDGLRYGASLKLENENYNDYFSKVRSKFFGAEAKRRIILGTFARMSGYRSQYYLKSMKLRTLIINDYKKAFKKVDCLLSPTMMFTAPRFDEISKLDPLQVYQSDLLTVGPNLAGIPMMNVPCGKDKRGLPIGFHVMSDHLNEQKVLNVSSAYEEAAR